MEGSRAKSYPEEYEEHPKACNILLQSDVICLLCKARSACPSAPGTSPLDSWYCLLLDLLASRIVWQSQLPVHHVSGG